MLLCLLTILSLLLVLLSYALFPGYVNAKHIFKPMNRILFDKRYDVPAHFQNIEMVTPMIGTFGGPNANGPSKLLPRSCYWYEGQLFCKT